jgi:hypothetical protein
MSGLAGPAIHLSFMLKTQFLRAQWCVLSPTGSPCPSGRTAATDSDFAQ